MFQRGDIPIFIAIEAGNQGLVKELLYHYGRDQVKESRTLTKDTALHIACRRKDTDIVRILVDAGAGINEKNVSRCNFFIFN